MSSGGSCRSAARKTTTASPRAFRSPLKAERKGPKFRAFTMTLTRRSSRARPRSFKQDPDDATPGATPPIWLPRRTCPRPARLNIPGGKERVARRLDGPRERVRFEGFERGRARHARGDAVRREPLGGLGDVG